MGIINLHKYLRPYLREVSLTIFAGETVGIDAMCWLHRGVSACAVELYKQQHTTKYVDFFMKMVRGVQRAGATPLVVFDGASLPAKKEEELDRKVKREEAHRDVGRLVASGKDLYDKTTYSKLVQCVRITSEMRAQVTDALNARHIAWMVAPYEADAQLAFMVRQGQLSAAISEDSDLIAYGCPRSLFKVNALGYGVEFSTAQWPTAPEGVPRDLAFLSTFTPEMITDACVLCGCDYTTTRLKGVGPSHAFKLIHRYRDLAAVLRNLPRDDKWRMKLPADYDAVCASYFRAKLVYQAHWVVDGELLVRNREEIDGGDAVVGSPARWRSGSFLKDVVAGVIDPRTLINTGVNPSRLNHAVSEDKRPNTQRQFGKKRDSPQPSIVLSTPTPTEDRWGCNDDFRPSEAVASETHSVELDLAVAAYASVIFDRLQAALSPEPSSETYQRLFEDREALKSAIEAVNNKPIPKAEPLNPQPKKRPFAFGNVVSHAKRRKDEPKENRQTTLTDLFKARD
ncbi:MAG: uncharacterized protein KVP18_004033 [Porospora cf. gigantea A]|uniref:uncharacterized protein n=1 Tax=Porospora cf. gigantea A TaxID=2853593 RepID=UPI003559ACD2|nr:MAG: hypothetical protein KVP18_004033 [Porospora cf. gigantea A]